MSTLHTPPKIALDAGHFLYTPGKRCLRDIDPLQTREWTLNSRVASMLAARLADYDCEVMRVDDVTGEHEVSLEKRCQKANEWDADIYLSIHHNSGVLGGTGGGTVVYYYSSDPVREAQARLLYDNVIAETGLVGNRSVPVVYRAYYVLKNTAMPALLLENGFMDSRTDTPIILTPEHAERTAIGLEHFLVGLLQLKKIVVPEPEPEPIPEDPGEDQEGEHMIIYNTLDEVPNWGKPTIAKLIVYGYLRGTDKGLELTQDMLRMLVINDRAGIYDIRRGQV